MSSSRRHHQTVDKLDRTITRLYTYLSGSEEGDEPLATAAASTSQQVGSSSRRLGQQQQQQHEPEYQQPYAYPAAHAHPFNPLAATAAATSGSTPNSSSSDNHTSSTTSTTGGDGGGATLLLAGDVDSSLSHHSLHRHRRHFQGTLLIQTSFLPPSPPTRIASFVM